MNQANSPVSKKILGLSALAAFGACAACCAAPLMVAAGIGGGLLSALAVAVRPTTHLLVAGVVGASMAGLLALRARARRDASSAHARQVGGGCGCGVSEKRASILSTPSPRADEPIVCTADLRDQPTVQAQLDGYRAAFERLLRVEHFERGVRWVFENRPGLELELKRLAENEHRCCAFFKFDLRVIGERILWETSANPGAEAVLEEFARLPERLAAHPRGSEARWIKRAIGEAGLIFAADAKPPK